MLLIEYIEYEYEYIWVLSDKVFWRRLYLQEQRT